MSTFSAELESWVLESERRVVAVVRQSANDMLNSIDVTAGINRGGSRVRGTIPRDLGDLVASLQVALRGTTVASGPAGATMAIAGYQLGDPIDISWGGAAAPHAPHVHYGANGVPGTFWIDVAAAKWPQFVYAAAARARSGA
jgi:hypothetical protein